MKRVTFVTRILDGREADLRQAQTSMPTDDLLALGIKSVETFIGSNYYIILLECSEADFQSTMQRFFNEPTIQGFLDKVRPHVEGLPERHEAYAASDEHQGGGQASQRGTAAVTVSSADLPLAASAYYWSASEGTVNTGLGGNGASMSGGSRTPER